MKLALIWFACVVVGLLSIRGILALIYDWRWRKHWWKYERWNS